MADEFEEHEAGPGEPEPTQVPPDAMIVLQGTPVWTKERYEGAVPVPGVVEVCCHALAPCDWHRDLARHKERLTPRTAVVQ